MSAGSVYVHSDDSIKVLNGVSIKVDGVSSGVLELEGNFAGNSTHNSSADASLQIGSGVSLSSRLGSISLQVSSGSALSIDSSSSVLAGMNISFGGNVNVTGGSTFVVSGDATFQNGSGVVSFALGGFGDLKSGSGVPVANLSLSSAYLSLGAALSSFLSIHVETSGGSWADMGLGDGASAVAVGSSGLVLSNALLLNLQANSTLKVGGSSTASIVFDGVDVAWSSGAHFVATSMNSSSSLLGFASSSSAVSRFSSGSSVTFQARGAVTLDQTLLVDRAPLLTLQSGSNGCEGGAANDILSLSSSHASILMNSSIAGSSSHTLNLYAASFSFAFGSSVLVGGAGHSGSVMNIVSCLGLNVNSNTSAFMCQALVQGATVYGASGFGESLVFADALQCSTASGNATLSLYAGGDASSSLSVNGALDLGAGRLDAVSIGALSIGANVSAGSVYVHSDDSIKVLNGVSIKVDGVSSGVLELEGNFAGNSTHNSSADASLQIGSGVSLFFSAWEHQFASFFWQCAIYRLFFFRACWYEYFVWRECECDWWQHVCGFWRCHFPERFRGCFVCTWWFR